MLRRSAWLLAPLLILLLAWTGWQWLHRAPQTLPGARGAQLEWTDCWFEVSPWRPVHCARLHTSPEAGLKPTGFALPVVYVPAPFWQRGGAPVVYVAGGPGGATGLDAESLPFWLDWIDQVGWQSDLVLYDQRGVGLAEPAVDCPQLRQKRLSMLDSELPNEALYAAMRDAAQACAQRLQGEGWQLARFNTPRNADDLLDLVETLGLEQWRLYGVSYGTRVALEVMRREPPGLQAAVLDSVYPPQVNGEAGNNWLLNRSLRLFTRSCELVGRCDYHRERLQAALTEVLARLQREPMRVELRDPRDGGSLQLRLDHEGLAWLIFESQYLWHNLELLPGAITALAQGNVSSELRSMLQDSLDALADTSLSEAVGSSVDCADNAPLAEAAFEASRRQFSQVADIVRLDWRYSNCRFWPSGDAGEAFRQPVHSEVPSLLLAGEFDPVTPPQWAYLAAHSLPRGQVFSFPGIGHGVLDSDACAIDLVQAFLRDPQAPQPPACLPAF